MLSNEQIAAEIHRLTGRACKVTNRQVLFTDGTVKTATWKDCAKSLLLQDFSERELRPFLRLSAVKVLPEFMHGYMLD